MDNFVQLVCNLWHRFKWKIIVGIIIFVVLTLVNIRFGWSYYFFDLVIKLFTGLAAIATAWGVYWKWNDEKTRQLYERRLQEVYSPLCKLIIRQEEYRNILCQQYSRTLNRNDFPILTTVTRRKRFIINPEAEIKEIDIFTKETTYVDRKNFLSILNESNCGLARPSLLALIAQYELLISLEKEKRKNLLEEYPDSGKIVVMTDKRKNEIESSFIGKECKLISIRRCSVEKEIVDEIIDGYNESVKKLDLDRKIINLDNPNFLEKTS